LPLAGRKLPVRGVVLPLHAPRPLFSETDFEVALNNGALLR
jgi:hypothetical protein